MAAAGVGQQIREQIAAGLGPLDQVVMRIDDRQIWLDDFLVAAFEPLRPDRQMHACRGWRCCAEHLTFPS
jgi:hypothetical protein